MDNKTYYENLQHYISTLTDLRLQGQKIAAAIIGQTLFHEDLFYISCVDRCLNLIDGFIIMLNNRNLTCAGALLRLQMDNCLRCYASFIAQNKEAFFDCIINGNPIKQQSSIDGNKLTDGYLKVQISKIDKSFKKTYNQASGYIHLSEKAFYQTVVKCRDNHVQFQIGLPLPEKRNTVLLEAAEAYIHFVHLLYTMLHGVANSKERYDQKHNG